MSNTVRRSEAVALVCRRDETYVKSYRPLVELDERVYVCGGCDDGGGGEHVLLVEQRLRTVSVTHGWNTIYRNPCAHWLLVLAWEASVVHAGAAR